MVRTLMANLKRQGRLIHWTIIAVSMAFVLMLGLAVLGYTVLRNTDIINRNSTAVHISCLAGNDFRVADRELWDQALTLPALHLTADQVAGADAILDETFTPRTC